MSIPSAKPRRFSWVSLVIALLVGLVVSAFLLLVLIGMGQVQGREFCPDDFSQRQFSYNQLPAVGWVLFKRTYDEIPNSMHERMVLDSLLPPSSSLEPRWHLTRENSNTNSLISSDCDARLLTKYFNMTAGVGTRPGSYWVNWHDQFTEQAIIFWPVVAQMARDELYLKLPEVMELAIGLTKDEASSFESELTKTAVEAYVEIAEIDFGLGDFERARDLFQSAYELKADKLIQQRISDCESKLQAVETAD